MFKYFINQLKDFFLNLEIKQLKLFVFIITFLSYLLLFPLFLHKLGNNIPTGDEPHYLLIAHSIIYDGDLDLKNNYLNKDYKSFLDHTIPDPHVTIVEDKWYSVHDIGLPLLISPIYYIYGYKGTALLMILFTSLLALNLFSFSYEVTEDKNASIFSWVVFSFTTPILFYSFQVFPEILGAIVILYSLRLANEIRINKLKISILGLLLSSLPWIHLRYAVLVPIISVISFIRYRLKKNLIIFVTPIIISGLLFMFYNHSLYKRILPDDFYIESDRFDILNPKGLMGLFFDQEYGLFFYSPIYIFFLLGIIIVIKEKKELIYLLGAPFLAQYLLVGFYKIWWGGWCPPGRYLIPILPIIAIFLSFSFSYIKKDFKRIYNISIFITYLTTVLLVLKPNLLYINNDGTSQLLEKIKKSIGIDLTPIFPSLANLSISTYIVDIMWLGIFIGFFFFILKKYKDSSHEKCNKDIE